MPQCRWSRLVFCHIPKTAGSSITRLLRDVIPGRHSVEATDTERPSSDIGAALKAGFTLISGHFNHVEVVAALDRAGIPGVRMMTTLRNPVDHVLSQFYHLISRESLNMGYDTGLAALKKRAETSSLLEFFSRSHDDVEGFFPLFDNPQIRLILGKMSGAVTLQDAHDAIALLQRFDAIILFEQLREALSAFLPRFGAAGDMALPRLMTNPLKDKGLGTLRRTELLALMNRTRFDAVLYDVIAAEWRTRVGQMPSLLARSEPVASLPPVLLADIIRASNASQIDNGVVGQTITMREDSLFLHPPHGAQGALRITAADFLAQGQSLFSTELTLEHPAAPPVTIDISIRDARGVVSRFATAVTAAAPVPVVIQFPPLYGRCFVDIVLATQDPKGVNDFAWMMFRRPRFCSSMPDAEQTHASAQAAA